MPTETELNLHIPPGINYDCTGCGKCCGGWAVPMTGNDYARISEVNWGERLPKFANKKLFRPLKDYEKLHTKYTHAIKPSEDGHCPFLVDNLCYIHSSFDAKFKPAMCQLFPYSFIKTPSGVFATVSFVSVGVCYNSGRALVDQRQWLTEKYQQYSELFPGIQPNWSQLKLAVGQPMTWDEYLVHEAKLVACLSDKSKTMEERFLAGSDYLISVVPKQTNQTNINNGESASSQQDIKLNKIDKHLLVALAKIYFPDKPLGKGEGDFGVLRFIYQYFYQSNKIATQTRSFSIEELHEFPWPSNDSDFEDLIFRYYFSRLFGKFYFGGGFGQLSLIAGFHHLILTYALLKLEAKASAINRGAPKVALLDLVQAVRQLEKRFGESTLNGYAAAIWELLMYSPARVRRILQNT